MLPLFGSEFHNSPKLAGCGPFEATGEPATEVRVPSELILKAAMVFECMFAANRKLPSGLMIISLSSSKSKLAGVGFGSYKPVPCIGNGEPVTGFNLPVPSLLKARIEL